MVAVRLHTIFRTVITKSRPPDPNVALQHSQTPRSPSMAGAVSLG
jgi:hypothetical protein